MRITLDTTAFHASLSSTLSDDELSVILAAVKSRRQAGDPGQEVLPALLDAPRP